MSGFARTISLLLVCLLILESRKCSGLGDFNDTKWWETTLVYQIWPRSYQDSDGDGVGDIQGIINRLGYIDALGVETICLCPIYPSPLVDSGYDVSDYKNVNPTLGDLSDIDKLIREAHERDMKVILDIVPSHTSNQHEWFNASINRIDPYTDYYVWANGTVNENGTMLPPKNWIRARRKMENSPWTWNDNRDQWYYHKLHEAEPELNLENPNVRYEIMLILEFWMNRGVDGFRILGVSHFFEDLDHRNKLTLDDSEYTYGQPRHVRFLHEIRNFVDDWTELNNSTSKYLIAESHDTDPNLLSYYGNDNTTGILPFNYRFIMDIANAGTNATKLANQIGNWLHMIPSNASTNWPLSNHANWRIASKIGSERLDIFHILSMLLPGQAFTYYGDEIGMLSAPILMNGTDDSSDFGILDDDDDNNDDDNDDDKHNVDDDDDDDVHDDNDDDDDVHDDNNDDDDNDDDDNVDDKYSVRTPMQWDDTISAGFSKNAKPYLPVNVNYTENNVEEQLNNSRSHLNVYKQLAELRKNPVFTRGDWELVSTNDDNILVLRRTLTDYPVYVVIINLGDIEQTVNMTEFYPDLDDNLDVIVTSGTDEKERTTVNRSEFGLLPNAGLVLKSNESGSLNSMDLDNDEEEEEEKDEKDEEMESTTDYVNMTTEIIETTSSEAFDESRKTLEPNIIASTPATTETLSVETMTPETTDLDSSSSNSISASFKFGTSVILTIFILAGVW